MRTEKSMSTATGAEVRYAMEAVRAIEAFKDLVGDVLRTVATDRAIAHGRSLVTAEDVFDSAPVSLNKLIERISEHDHSEARR
jgi:hypothetical protein